jgi:hypothetical protein
MRALSILAAAAFCLSSGASFASGANTIYSCYFLDESGTPKAHGYRVKLWFDTCVDARYIPPRAGSSIDCELDAFGKNPDELAFDCKVNDEQLMTLTMNKTSLKARAKFMEGKEYTLQCKKV